MGDLDSCLAICCHSKEASGHKWLIVALNDERRRAIRLAAVTRTELEYARKARP